MDLSTCTTNVPAALVGSVALVHRTQRRLQGRYAHVLDGLGHTGVQVGLHREELVHQVSVADGHTEPPAGHVVGLGEGVKLYPDILRALDFQEARRPVAVVGDLCVAGVVHDGHVVPLREGDGLLEIARPLRSRQSGCSGN